MIRQRTAFSSTALVAVGFFACAGAQNPFADEEDTATWANSASALGVWTNIHDVVAFTLGEANFMDPNCPVSEDDGTLVTLTGGCTAIDGRVWVGEATITRLGERDLDLEFDGFGGADEEGGSRRTGDAQVREIGENEYSFGVWLVVDAGMTTTVEYEGTVVGDFDTPTTWSGAGRVVREGGLGTTGTVEASTEAQRFDDAICAGQALSGTTTLTAKGHTAEIRYDGEEACDDDDAAQWSVDGEDRGEIVGITCAVLGGDARRNLLPLALLGLVVGLRRRRKSPCRDLASR